MPCRVLDSSDACDEANVHFQELLCWTTYIRRYHELYFPRPEPRREILEMGALMALPVLVAAGLPEAAADEASRDIAEEVLDRLLPAVGADAPEPGPSTFERLARAMEFRRRALRKLLKAVAPDASAEQLDALAETARDWTAASEILEALMTGSEDNEDPDRDEGNGEDRSPHPPAGDAPGGAAQADLPGGGAPAADDAGGAAPGSMDPRHHAGRSGRSACGSGPAATGEALGPDHAGDPCRTDRLPPPGTGGHHEEAQ